MRRDRYRHAVVRPAPIQAPGAAERGARDGRGEDQESGGPREEDWSGAPERGAGGRGARSATREAPGRVSARAGAVATPVSRW